MFFPEEDDVSEILLGTGCVTYAGFKGMLGGSFYEIIFLLEEFFSLSTRCGRGRGCFVVMGK